MQASKHDAGMAVKLLSSFTGFTKHTKKGNSKVYCCVCLHGVHVTNVVCIVGWLQLYPRLQVPISLHSSSVIT